MSLMLFLEKIHGHVALLGIALCYHPWFALKNARRPSWAARLSAYLATGTLSASIVMGWIIYPEYRRSVRQTLYLTSRVLGKAFEVKEHIGTFALFLLLAGAVLTWLSNRPGGAQFTQTIRRVYLVAAILATISALVGIYLASVYSFPYEVGPGAS